MNMTLDKPTEKNLKRAAELVFNIHSILNNANSYTDFATGKADSKDANHLIRVFHDAFLLDAHTNKCAGTIYRSQDVIQEQNIIIGRKTTSREVHGEHAIPINLMSRYIYEKMKSSSIHKLGEFLLSHQLVCAITLFEQKSLSKKRSYVGLTKSWARDHPNFKVDKRLELKSLRGEKIELNNVQVFARYIGTDIKIYSVITNKDINVESFTISDHINSLGNQHIDTNNSFFKYLNKYAPILNVAISNSASEPSDLPE